MLGRFLKSLSTERLMLVLTHEMLPGSFAADMCIERDGQRHRYGPCLVGVTMMGGDGYTAMTGDMILFLDGFKRQARGEPITVMNRYDLLTTRFMYQQHGLLTRTESYRKANGLIRDKVTSILIERAVGGKPTLNIAVSKALDIVQDHDLGDEDGAISIPVHHVTRDRLLEVA